MRRLVRWGVAFVAVLAVSTAPVFAQTGAAEPRYGYVDTDRLLRETPGAASADSVFQREFAQWQAQLGAVEDTLRRLIAEYDRQQVTLTPEAKDRRQQEIRDKQGQYQRMEADLARRAEQRRAELLSPIMKKILDAVEQVRRERKYEMVFTAQALVAADTILDLTDEVIARMKAARDTAQKRN